MQLANSELRDKVDALEKKYDGQFKVVFMAIRKLMSPPLTKPRQIGFRSKTSKSCGFHHDRRVKRRQRSDAGIDSEGKAVTGLDGPT